MMVLNKDEKKEEKQAKGNRQTGSLFFKFLLDPMKHDLTFHTLLPREVPMLLLVERLGCTQRDHIPRHNEFYINYSR